MGRIKNIKGTSEIKIGGNGMDVYRGIQTHISNSIEESMARHGYRGAPIKTAQAAHFPSILDLGVGELCDFNNRNYRFMEHHMNLNILQYNERYAKFGTGALRSSTQIGNTVDEKNPFAQRINYVDNFQKLIESSEENGGDTTRMALQGNNKRNYEDINQLYTQYVDLFPDDSDKGNGSFNNKWNVGRNKDSILYKTKELFRQGKINTIISRFHTEPGTNAEKIGDNKSKYGLSHGRNLLTYEAENQGTTYMLNGYDNPYCRVWTHHWKYDRLSKMIRPFVSRTENGEGYARGNVNAWAKNAWDTRLDTNSNERNYGTGGLESMGDNYIFYAQANGKEGKILESDLDKKERPWGWRDKGVDERKKSVLDNETGLLKITPKYNNGNTVHTKDCMFSIENLAWQGYDPYSFEKALSWEQRGPFGGRIMWFPPYGLRFSEDTSVNWTEHSFIGRGENVFTYTNTSRSGTLEFMMVVDHPSIIDYALWDSLQGDDGSTVYSSGITDTDLLRFFAGCEGDNHLKDKTKPTPLTNEVFDDPKPAVEEKEEKKEEDKPVEKEEKPDEPIEISFYVFYPNNYSGAYDNDEDSVVNPIAYLLAGRGTQWRADDDDPANSQEIPIDFDTSFKNNNGTGYEMSSFLLYDGQETEKDYIIGTSPNWKKYEKENNIYVKKLEKKWFYRIDGCYDVSDGKQRPYANTFDQTPPGGGYADKKTFGLNCDIESVKDVLPDEAKNNNLYTLAEVAAALYKTMNKETIAQTIAQKAGWNSTAQTENQNTNDNADNGEEVNPEKRIEKLCQYFSKDDNNTYTVQEISAAGYSNSHGSNPSTELNEQRNEFLAKKRAETALKWFKTAYNSTEMRSVNLNEKKDDNFDSAIKAYKSMQVEEEDRKNVDGKSAKAYRSAKVTIKLQKTKIETPKDLDTTTGQSEQPVYAKYKGFEYVGNDADNKTPYYKSLNETDPTKKNRLWYYNAGSKEMRLLKEDKREDDKIMGKEGANDDVASHYNKLRYDQEYFFFKQLKLDHPMVFNKLIDKLQYFQPGFHSTTPEGFLGRLNFLHQCTRQGNTIGASDPNGLTANNLAFGRPPFCVLRIGDFYYQKIVIRNININYDPLVLDLNEEGAGVVPLIANVTISFNFIGGGSLDGPIRRLQNAQSFNFYAANQLFDNRADRVKWNMDDKKDPNYTQRGKTNVDWENSYFYNTKMMN